LLPWALSYNTAITVLLASPSPVLLTVIMRYSGSSPRCWSDKVTSLSMDIPASVRGLEGRRAAFYFLGCHRATVNRGFPVEYHASGVACQALSVEYHA
jgi:hypothetical protein